MRIEVEESQNGPASEQFEFKELGKSRPVRAIRAEWQGKEILCDIIGVAQAGEWTQVQALKIADSSEGHAFLIHGGAWGIRLRPAPYSLEPWDLSNPHQWGEPFKIYGSEEDIFYEE